MGATLVLSLVAAVGTLAIGGATVDGVAPHRPAASGVYQSYSPLSLTPVAPIDPADASRLLGRWLRVKTADNASTIVFEPEGQVVWRVRTRSNGGL